MIYIDPPYNIGNDSFIYPDKLSETKEEYLKHIGEKSEDGSLIKQEEGEQKKLYFVAETKGTSSLQELEQSKPLEAMKIKCGIKHFAQFEDVRFRQVRNFIDL